MMVRAAPAAVDRVTAVEAKAVVLAPLVRGGDEVGNKLGTGVLPRRGPLNAALLLWGTGTGTCT